MALDALTRTEPAPSKPRRVAPLDVVGKSRSFLQAQLKRASELGHTLTIEQRSDENFRVLCTCGYSSTRRRTEFLAISAGVHHSAQVVADHGKDGGAPVRVKVHPPVGGVG